MAGNTTDYNAVIIEAIRSMPEGGIYGTNSAALASLRGAIASVLSDTQISASDSTPSFCSGATYLIFLSAIANVQREGRLQLDENLLSALRINPGQVDGNGVWGRWNANGPGTARLFFEAGLGRNFTSLEEARPGDFLKVFWNEKIGAGESGHSVIFLGRIANADGESIKYWSSNQSGGYGTKEVSLKRIKRTLFSRFEHPEHIGRLRDLPPRDIYLASLLKRSSSEEEMLSMIGLKDAILLYHDKD